MPLAMQSVIFTMHVLLGTQTSVKKRKGTLKNFASSIKRIKAK